MSKINIRRFSGHSKSKHKCHVKQYSLHTMVTCLMPLKPNPLAWSVSILAKPLPFGVLHNMASSSVPFLKVDADFFRPFTATRQSSMTAIVTGLVMLYCQICFNPAAAIPFPATRSYLASKAVIQLKDIQDWIGTYIKPYHLSSFISRHQDFPCGSVHICRLMALRGFEMTPISVSNFEPCPGRLDRLHT